MAQGIPGKDYRQEAAGWLWEQERAEREVTEEQRQRELEEAEQLNGDILRVFSSPSGRRVWEWLWRQTIMQPTFNAALGMDNGTAHGFAREGQNALIMEMHRRMEQARNPDKE